MIAFCSLVFVAYLAIRRLVVGPEAEGVFTLFGIAFFLIGMALLGLGVVGEYVGRIYEQVRQRPRYTIAAVLGGDAEPAQLREPRADLGAELTALPQPLPRARGGQE